MIRPAATWAAFLAIVSVSNYSAAQSDPSLFNTVINVPPNTAPSQIGSNTQLNLKPGGMLNSITGGPNSTFDAGVRGAANVNVEVNISGGTGAGIFANAGSTINMSGGDIYLGPGIGFALRADNGSNLNMTGGRLLSRVGAFAGSSLNLSGGSVFSFMAETGSVVQKSGGTVVRELMALPGSNVQLVGGEFQLDGLPYTNPTINLMDGTSVFTGTLADGTPFLLTPMITDRLSNVTLTQVPIAPANLTPIIVSSATPTPPAGLRTGQSLTLNSGKLRDGFQAYGAQMLINGGDVGFATRVVDTRVDFNGGRVGRDFAAFGDSLVNVAGGEVGPGFISDSAIVNVTSGKIDDNFLILHGSTATVSGGIVGRFVAIENSTLNMSNGFVDSGLRAYAGSIVNLSGGRIADNSSAQTGSLFNITGGEIGTNFTMHTGSTVNISGGRLLGNSSGFGGEVRIQGGEVNVSGTAELGRTVMSSSLGRVNVFGGTIGDNSWISFWHDASDGRLDWREPASQRDAQHQRWCGGRRSLGPAVWRGELIHDGSVPERRVHRSTAWHAD